jgi:Domain of unknown function (DUF4159)
MRFTPLILLVLLVAVVCAAPARVAEPPRRDDDRLADQVREAIAAGKKYLRQAEAGSGNLERSVEGNAVFPGGLTALATFALLTSGASPGDGEEMTREEKDVKDMVNRCLTYLRGVPPEQTYVVALQTMVYAAAGQTQDKDRIQKNVDWLLRARHYETDLKGQRRLKGWSYQMGGTDSDNSNTQYALLGLHEGKAAGARIDPKAWEEIREYYTRHTEDNQGRVLSYVNWGYKNGNSPIPTMTASALCGMVIAGMDLNAGRETLRPDGTADRCGVYEEDEHLANALKLIGRQMPHSPQDFNSMPHTYYYLYSIERAGRLSGQRFLGGVDWYRLGCRYLVDRQNKADGSWLGEGHSIIATSFALLFLAKGRTPVLMSKLVHGPGQDWNNDRNDARNLTAFASAELFRKKPLAWQVFDVRSAPEEDLDRLTADLLQSPIVYFNGHHTPQFREGEEKLLQKYVENGGFILAEACCGRDEFKQGFPALMARLFPEKLQRLKAGHPIWTASGLYRSDPDKYELWGINMGCKTVIVFSPQDLSCRWESNNLNDPEVRSAFELGANIIAYATGMEPPKPRLTQMAVLKDDSEKKTPRGYLKVAQLRHDGDWRPAPQAMPNLMLEMRKLGLDVALQTEEVRPLDRDFVTFKFLYLHGRRDFGFASEEQKRLRFNLETGGLLLADACCGSKEFDQGFRQLMKEMYPDRPLEAIPLNDDLFGEELNGTPITTVHCRRTGPDGRPESGYRSVPPQLEGIKVNGRWAVIYSKYDIGCALENHPSVDCLGHDHASAVQLARAAVLYAMRR